MALGHRHRCHAAAAAARPAGAAGPWAAGWPVLGLGLALGLISGVASAQSKEVGKAQIYTCVDDRGRRLTSDRPISECIAKEQRLLNRDGSVRQVVPPTLTAEERADREAMEARAAEVRAAQADAVRRDRNLRNRFPNEAAHRKSRELALDTVRVAMKNSEVRLLELSKERKPLLEEAEFFKGRALPPKLQQLLAINDTSVDAQRSAIANQEAELVRINRLFDAELEHLRKLWAGAQPGTIGAPPLPADMPIVQNTAQRGGVQR